MATWTTHTEGGSWTGGGTALANCTSAQQTLITDAFNAFIDAPCLDCFPGLRSALRDKWSGIEINCTTCSDPMLYAFQSGNGLTLCYVLASGIGALVLHELVHAVGGTELDCEAVEHACFIGSGATLPTDDDWPKFRSETGALNGNEKERVGNYAIWNSDTGEVWGRETVGGGWLGGDPAKGSLCFQHDQWMHAYSTGGGWV